MNSFTNKAAIVLASALTLGASAVTSAGARWDMPTPYGDGTHQTQVARSFAEEINAKADGKLTADLLLDSALSIAENRVVVKRPRKAPFLADRKPSLQFEGKSSRYDIYPLKKLQG